MSSAERFAGHDDIPLEVTRQIDEVCDQFEHDLAEGRPVRLQPMLDQVDARWQGPFLAELIGIAAEHWERTQDAEAPGRLLAEHPELAEEIRRLLPDALATRTFGAQGSTVRPQRRGLHVRCPHCHNPIELVPDAELESIACPSCGSDFSLVSDDAATRAATQVTEVAHFRLIERVGMGAFGSVWKAHDTRLDRTVAVKIPRKGQFDEHQEKSFFREAQNAAQLNHPSIVPVHEVGRDGDTLFIVSDFVRGPTLADWLTGQQPTCREAAQLCVKIAEALQHAHDRGVVHRDLKPGNIMLDDNGEPHLMDFGLAKREAAEITMSIDGQIIGTPAYMSPEQAAGDAKSTDQRSDIYSLGVILFQLLTGELPFRGNARMLIHQVINDEPPSPRKLNGSVPKDLETITLKCLEKSPDKRYHSAAEIASELSAHLAGEPIKARPIGHLTRSVRFARKRPLVVAALSLVICTAIASWYGATAMSIEAERARAAESSARTANVKADAVTRQLEEAAAYTACAFASRLLRDGDVDGAMRSLSQCPERLRGFPWNFLHAQASERQRIVDERFPTVGVVALSRDPDGDRMFIAGGDRRLLFLEDSQVISARRTRSDAADLTAACFNWREEEALLGFADGTVLLWDARDDKYRRIVTANSELVSAASYSLTLNEYCVATAGQLLRIRQGDTKPFNLLEHPPQDSINWSYTGGMRHHRISGIVCMQYSGDGKLLVGGGSSGDVLMWELDSSGGPTILGRHPPTSWGGGAFATSLSPDRSSLVSGGRTGDLRFWDIASRSLENVIHAHEGAVTAIEHSTDGRRVASISVDATLRIWDAAAANSLESPRRFNRPLTTLSTSLNFKDITVAGWGDDATTVSYDDRPSVELYRSADASVDGIIYAPSLGGAVTYGSGTPSYCIPDTGNQLNSLAATSLPGERLLDLAVSHSGEIAVAIDEHRRVKILNPSVGVGEVSAVSRGIEGPYTVDRPTACTIDQAGNRVVVGCHSGAIYLLGANDGELLNHCNLQSPILNRGIKWGRHIVALLESGDVAVLDHENLTLMRTLRFGPLNNGESGRARRGVAISANGEIAAIFENTVVRIYDLGQGGVEIASHQFFTEAVTDVSLGQDGKYLVTTDRGGAVCFWNPRNSQLLLRMDDDTTPTIADYNSGAAVRSHRRYRNQPLVSLLFNEPKGYVVAGGLRGQIWVYRDHLLQTPASSQEL